jgi:hypothetical protein
VKKFVFCHYVIKWHVVDIAANFPYLAVKAHLFLQPPVGCVKHFFRRPRMAATSICPQAAAVVLAQGALLKQRLTYRVENKHREPAVKLAFTVCEQLFLHANRFVTIINENDAFEHPLNARMHFLKL